MITADPIDVSDVQVPDDLRELFKADENLPTLASVLAPYSKRRLSRLASGWPKATTATPEREPEPAEEPAQDPEGTPDEPTPNPIDPQPGTEPETEVNPQE